jgi:Cd2+/Zn2+-exporting ATPase
MTVVLVGNDEVLMHAVRQAGYEAEREESTLHSPADKPVWWRTPRTLTTIASGMVLATATVLDWMGMEGPLVVGFYAGALVIGGYHTALRGWASLRSFSLDMNFLMTAAIIGAAAIGQWSEGAAVAFLFAFGNTLQTYTMDKTRQSLRSLMELAPSEAWVRRNHRETRVPVEALVIGDCILVKPGERIAMDGIVSAGSSAVNQATITGESIPVEKAAGDPVFAGTLNEHGALEVTVTKRAVDSTLATISRLVEEAQAQKAPSQQFVDVFARYYTPLVLTAAAAVMVLPWLAFHQEFAPWFYNGLVLLVISCPCALVISTPVSIVAAIGNASRHGILIKGGAYLEEMGDIEAIAFDKTGTLTQGSPVVTDILPLNGSSATTIVQLAAGIERWSEHPLARAVVAKGEGLAPKEAVRFKALVGQGARAEIDGQTMYIGNTRLFTELGHDLTGSAAAVTALEQQGKTVLLLGTAQVLHGLIAVADIVREGSREAIAALHRAGMGHIVMLTGDNERVAAAIAGQLGMDGFYSELLPEDKVAVVKKIAHGYGKVAMVGEGVNDAPALAIATVGIAMGVAGSDTALETADVALMTDDLGHLEYLIRLSHKTVAIIKQNVAFSLLIKIIFLLLLVLGQATLWLAVFADMGASLLVTINGMRLMRRLR